MLKCSSSVIPADPFEWNSRAVAVNRT